MLTKGAADGRTDGVCVVVGAGPGLGSAIARRFAVEGLHLALINRSREAMESLANELSDQGPRPLTEAIEVTDHTALSQALHRIEDQLGPARILIYNAAAATYVPPSLLAPATLSQDFAVNVTAPLAAAQLVLPGMRSMGAGTILFTGGGAALYPAASMGSLPMTKAAVRALTFALHDELSDEGIHVGTVTVAGIIGDSPVMAPERIAECFWELHSQSGPSWSREIIYPTRT